MRFISGSLFWTLERSSGSLLPTEQLVYLLCCNITLNVTYSMLKNSMLGLIGLWLKWFSPSTLWMDQLMAMNHGRPIFPNLWVIYWLLPERLDLVKYFMHQNITHFHFLLPALPDSFYASPFFRKVSKAMSQLQTLRLYANCMEDENMWRLPITQLTKSLPFLQDYMVVYVRTLIKWVWVCGCLSHLSFFWQEQTYLQGCELG